MGKEIVALQIFRRVLKDRKISNKDLARLHSEYGSSVSPKEGQNRNCVAAAACKLAKKKKEYKVPLEDITAYKGGWAPVFGPETFSPEYSGWWAFSLRVLYGDDWWDSVGKVWIAANALAAIKPPKVIRLVTKRGESERRLSGKSAWRWGDAPFSQMPGPRFLWRDPLSVHTLIQRAISHPCLGLAAGRKVRITDWDHGNYGLPLRILLGKKAKRPKSWGTVKLGKKAVEHLDWLPPLPKGVWFRYQWFEDGTKIVAMSRGRANTRGTVPLSVSKGNRVTYYTASKDRGKGGTWWSCFSELDKANNRWLVKSQDRVLKVKMPGKPTMEVLWDSKGAHVVGKAPKKPAKPDSAKVKKAMVLIDQAVKGAALEVQARTAAAVLRRILRGERSSAHEGAKVLRKKLKGAPKKPPASGAKTQITKALTLIDQAIPGAPLEAQARTGAAVLKRTLLGNGPSAYEGSKALVAKLA